MIDDYKCTKCGESYFVVESSTQTLVYYRPIFKNGINVNPPKNKTTQKRKCLNCGHKWEAQW